MARKRIFSTATPATSTEAGAPRGSRSHALRLPSALLIGGLALATLGTKVGPGVSAFFTDTAPLNTNTFTAGTLNIKLNNLDAVTGLFNLPAMAPGDSSTQSVVVSNAGSLALRYSIAAGTFVDTAGLKDVMTLKIKTLGTSCAAFDGTSLYDSTTGNDGIDGPASGALVGSATQGNQAGDRTLAASASETLCFQVALPLAAPNTAQGATTTAQWVFSAEQTANNP